MFRTLLIAAALHRHNDPIRPPLRLGPSTSTSDGPLARELARCQSIGMAAKDDMRCEAAWAENRRRFFTYRPPAAPASAAGKRPNE